MEPVRIQEAAFDPGTELNAFTAQVKNAGAVVSFSGITRDISGASLDHMLIEHYPAMTAKALRDIRAQALERFALSGAMILHRFGRLHAGDVIMMIATAAPHRADAFHGAEFLMDYLKSRAPFWKKEVTKAGAYWVEAKDEDEDALSRWT